MKRTQKLLRTATLLFISILLLAACTPASTTPGTETSASTIAGTTEPAATTTAGAETTTDATTTSGTTESVNIKVAALKGPTGIGLVQLMQEAEEGKAQGKYSFTLSGAPDEVVALVSSGQADIAALPTNVAPLLYKKTEKSIKLLAVNTLGVLHILEKGDSIKTFAGLAGHELLATGQGAVPEFALNELLDQAGIKDDVKITYKGEHEELATLAAAGEADLVMLPEPFVTSVLAKNQDMRVAFDLTEVWQELHAGQSESELAMGCMIVNKDFAAANPAAVELFLEEYARSVKAVNEDPQAAGQLVAQYGIMASAELAEKAIPNCHIVLIKGDEMKQVLEPFYEVLFAANPQSIGGELPEDEFYYNK